MSKRTDLFPGWFFGPGGASQLCETEADVPKGWTDNQAEAAKLPDPKSKKAEGAADGATTAPAKPPKAPTEGAAEKPANELGAARAEYRAKFGKGPSPRWDAETLRAKIAEAPATEQQHDL
jgi:hypothetical protein